MTKTYYTTDGDVRGACDHQHRTPGAAWACIARDHAGCARQGGYSDREVYRMPGTERMIEDADGSGEWMSVDEWADYDAQGGR